MNPRPPFFTLLVTSVLTMGCTATPTAATTTASTGMALVASQPDSAQGPPAADPQGSIMVTYRIIAWLERPDAAAGASLPKFAGRRIEANESRLTLREQAARMQDTALAVIHIDTSEATITATTPLSPLGLSDANLAKIETTGMRDVTTLRRAAPGTFATDFNQLARQTRTPSAILIHACLGMLRPDSGDPVRLNVLAGLCQLIARADCPEHVRIYATASAGEMVFARREAEDQRAITLIDALLHAWAVVPADAGEDARPRLGLACALVENRTRFRRGPGVAARQNELRANLEAYRAMLAEKRVMSGPVSVPAALQQLDRLLLQIDEP